MADSVNGLPPPQFPSSEWDDFIFFNDNLGSGAGDSLDFYPQPANYDMYNPDKQPTLKQSPQHSLSHQQTQRSLPSADLAQSWTNAHLSPDQRARGQTASSAAARQRVESKKNSVTEKINFLRNKKAKAKKQQPIRPEPSSGPSGPSAGGASTTTANNSYPSTAPVHPSQQNHQPSPYGLDMHPSQQHYNQTFSQDPLMNSLALNNMTHGAAEWQNDLTGITLDQSLIDPVAAHNGLPITSSQPMVPSYGSSAYAPGRANELVHPSPLKYKVSGNMLPASESTHTLSSNVSSLGDGNTLLTPPDPAPSLPWLSSEYDSRRTSDSSELAHNVEGMHLQQATANLTRVFTGSHGPSPHSSTVSVNGMATPDTSPEQFAGKSYGRSDLAARRNRSRPAAIRPDVNRSVSSIDPLSHSPHSRNSSFSLGPTGPPRRTQSSGQPLQPQFRIHKQNSFPAQVSPRNLQTHFDKQAVTHSSRRTGMESGTASPPTPSHGPSASAASANRSPAEYQHEFAIRDPSSTQGPTSFFQMPRYANASVPNLHATPGHTQGPLSINVPSQSEPQGHSHPAPPLSAPPQQTTFFEPSPSSGHGPFPLPGSQTSAYGPSHATGLAFDPLAAQQASQILPPENNGYYPVFAPSIALAEGPHMANYQNSAYVPTYTHAQLHVGSLPSVELDIRVEVGPQPTLSRRFEKCDFQHVSSTEYVKTTEKKGKE